MNSEAELLKSLWKNDGKGSVRALSAGSNFGIDYTRYLLGELQRKKMIAPHKGQKDLFLLTSYGKKRFAAIGFIGEKTGKVVRVKKAGKRKKSAPKTGAAKTRKVGRAYAKKTKSKQEKKYEINVRPPELAQEHKVVLAHNLDDSSAVEQKTRAGGAIEKAARYLKDLLREDHSL